MSKKFFFIVVGIWSLFTVSRIEAATSQSAVLFLRIAAGARAAGMGESFVAISDDATATHWNPAGLGLYPLTSTWLDYELAGDRDFAAVALLKNEIPENNYRKYDVWGIAGEELVKWDGYKFSTGETYFPQPGETIESVLKRYITETDPEKVKQKQRLLASINNPVSLESLEDLKETVDSALPVEYKQAEELKQKLENLLAGWWKISLDKEQLGTLKNLVREALADKTLNTLELDKILFTLEKTVSAGVQTPLSIPFRLFLSDTLTTLASNGEEVLWIGTRNRLFRYDGKSWKRIGKNEGVPNEQITTLAISPLGMLWIGTEGGLVRYDGKSPQVLSLGPDVQDSAITQIALKGEKNLYLSTKSDLFFYDGTNFSSYLNYKVKVGDELEKLMQRYLGTQDKNKVSRAVSKVKEINSLTSDEINVNQILKIPYNLSWNGEITSIAVDKWEHLWVGTTWGIKRFDGEKWSSYGYVPYTSKKSMSVIEIAKNFIPAADTTRLRLLSEKIITYNQLESDRVDSGQTVYVYRNIAGGRILSLLVANDHLFVGTEFGTIEYIEGTWRRYYHAGLEKLRTFSMIYKDGEIWFASQKKVVVYAHARKEITFMHANWLPELASDLYYEYLSYVQHMEGLGTWGLNVTFLSLGSSERTDEFGTALGEFSSYDIAFSLSYGTKLTSNLFGGMSAKFIYSNLSQVGAGRERGKGTGTSFALDAGLIYKAMQEKLSLAAVITNLGPNITYIDADQSDPLPRNLALGLAYKLVDNPYNKLTLVGEINKDLVGVGTDITSEFEEAIENIGLEYWYGSFIALRTGYIYDRVGNIKTLTFGAGLQYSNYRFDFAYIPASQNALALSNTMRFSMTGRF